MLRFCSSLLTVALAFLLLSFSAQQANNACSGEVQKDRTGLFPPYTYTYTISDCTGECDPSTPCEASQTTSDSSEGTSGWTFCGCGGADEASPGCCHIAYGYEWVDDGEGGTKKVATGEVKARGSCNLTDCPSGGLCSRKQHGSVYPIEYTAFCNTKISIVPNF